MRPRTVAELLEATLAMNENAGELAPEHVAAIKAFAEEGRHQKDFLTRELSACVVALAISHETVRARAVQHA